MGKTTVTISLEFDDLKTIEAIQRDRRFKNRSEAVQWILRMGFNKITDQAQIQMAQTLGQEKNYNNNNSCSNDTRPL